MANYIGIDLGTTNSAICSYDGLETKIWKSPEQSDVTPSAIYIDRRGNRYYGQKAYNQSAYNPGNSATLFKRFIGTDTVMRFEDADIEMSPEECSAEILRVLCGYLPESIRNDDSAGTVITVPAAFNAMKKDATMEAARLAGIGRVALMQEPVAAVMSVLKTSQEDGMFLVYDLGGGTFDVSIADNIGGKVSLLSHGGIEMCGGRDIDRLIFERIVMPWLRANFNLPEELEADKKYKKVIRIAQWAAERAKIEVSYSGKGTIAMSEDEMRCTDLDGEEMYLDIDISQEQMDSLISGIVEDTVRAAGDAIKKTGLRNEDIRKIVFIGGPTNYAPLRERVSAALGIETNTDANPMTAVAEGAAIYAESIDWSDENHARKTQKGMRQIGEGIKLSYIARTASEAAAVLLQVSGEPDGYVEFKCEDTGWSSGQILLEDGRTVMLPLTQRGDNRFKAVFTGEGGSIREPEQIVITRTMATVSAIPASHSIGIEVKDRLGGRPELVFLVREGDSLPISGTIRVKAGKTIRSGSAESINIKLWEGDIQTRIDDNRFIGVLKIRGTDIEAGMIPTGADIDCEYEVSDSGQIRLEASVPYIAAVFKGNNLYSRQEGTVLDKMVISRAGQKLADEITDMLSRIPDSELYKAKTMAQNAANAGHLRDDDAEQIQKADNDLLEARKIADRFRRQYSKLLLDLRIDKKMAEYESVIREHATAAEDRQVENYFKLARQAVDQDGGFLDDILRDIDIIFGNILWRLDWYVIRYYQSMVRWSAEYDDMEQFEELKERGDRFLADGNIEALRGVVISLLHLEKDDDDEGETGTASFFDEANIIKG